MRSPYLFYCFILHLLFIAGCKKDSIQTYRVPKETESPMMAPPLPSAGSSNDISWKTPEQWTEKPLSSMRVGSFSAKSTNGNEIDISVVSLSGDAGGTLANVNRWRDQIGLTAITQDQLEQATETLSVNQQPMIVADMVSKDNIIEGKSKKRLVAVICNRPTKSWFIKMTGEDTAVKEFKSSLRQFLSSLQFHD